MVNNPQVEVTAVPRKDWEILVGQAKSQSSHPLTSHSLGGGLFHSTHPLPRGFSTHSRMRPTLAFSLSWFEWRRCGTRLPLLSHWRWKCDIPNPPNILVGGDASQDVGAVLGLVGEILTSVNAETACASKDVLLGGGLLAGPCTVPMAAVVLAAPLASKWAWGLLCCAFGLSMLVKVLSRQINAPPACFIYHYEDHSVGREGSLLPIQKFHKRGALMCLVLGKPQNVGWAEGTEQVILQKSCISLE